MYTVYVLYNNKVKKIYIGQTNNINKRLNEHNDPNNYLSRYTKKYLGKWELIYKEEVNSREQALLREKQLKSSRGRDFIHALVVQRIERVASDHKVGGSIPSERASLALSETKCSLKELYNSQIEAAKREREIKGWRREKKLLLIMKGR